MRGRIVLSVVIFVLALLGAAPALASPDAQFGIQDDAWLMYGPGALSERLTTLDRLGTHLVRFTVRWDQIARTKPVAPQRTTPLHVGTVGDRLRAHARGITALVTLNGSPAWANGGHAANWLPSSGFADFAYAASKRFPWVHLWTVWNEPNSRTSAVPVSPSMYVRTLLNPAYVSLHQASSANLVAGGVTSPRRTPSGMSPLAFMQGMKAAHARLDAYAQNP